MLETDEIRKMISTIESMKDPISTLNGIGEDSTIDLKKMAEYLRDMKKLKDNIDSLSSKLTKVFDYLRIDTIPQMIEEQGIKSPPSWEGIGKLVITRDLRVSLLKDNRESFYKFLEDLGFEDAVTPTIHVSTLKSITKKLIEGLDTTDQEEDYSETLFNLLEITPFKRASLIKE